jgi:hypothetical protein
MKTARIITLGLAFLASCATSGKGADTGEYIPQPNPFAGEWREGEYTWRFDPDGNCSVLRGEERREKAAYLVRGNVLVTLSENTNIPATYTFEIKDGDTIAVNREGVQAVYRRIETEHADGPDAGEAGSPAFISRSDGFSGKNWNAPHKNNMHDRWEFRHDGTFHFWHNHRGRPLDRGITAIWFRIKYWWR